MGVKPLAHNDRQPDTQPRISPLQKQYARTLRRSMTDAEQKLWSLLRRQQMGGYRFRRQHPVRPYIVDFACLEAHLAVEVDGGHHVAQVERDQQRTRYLEASGFRILRFWNNEVLTQSESVRESIGQALSLDKNPLPNLPPGRGKELL
jgi:very-short-patch-repair endonuclease